MNNNTTSRIFSGYSAPNNQEIALWHDLNSYEIKKWNKELGTWGALQSRAEAEERMQAIEDELELTKNNWINNW